MTEVRAGDAQTPFEDGDEADATRVDLPIEMSDGEFISEFFANSETNNNNNVTAIKISQVEKETIKKLIKEYFLKLYGQELSAQEVRYQAQVDSLTLSLAERQEEVQRLKEQIEALTTSKDLEDVKDTLQVKIEELKYELRRKDTQMEGLKVEMQFAQNESLLGKEKLRKLEKEVTTSKEQAAILQEQLIGANYNKGRTEELTLKVRDLEAGLKGISEEKEKLQASLAELETEREDEIQIIQDALDEAAQEREELIQSFQKEFDHINSISLAREQQMMEDFEWKMREMEKGHRKKLDEKDLMAERGASKSEDEEERKQNMAKIKSELNAQWEEKLQSECSRLKTDLDALHSEEKHLAVESMKLQKEQEMQAVKKSWELKQEEMMKEISTLKDSLTDKDAYYHKELETQRTSADRDIWELRRKLHKLDEASYDQRQQMEEKHREELERMKVDYEDRLADLQRRAAIAEVDANCDVRAELEKLYKEQMEYLGQQHRASMERLREELEADKFQAVEEARVILTNQHEYINSSLKDQLSEAVASNTKHREEVETVRHKLARREEVIASLEEDLRRMRGRQGGSEPPLYHSPSMGGGEGFSTSQYSISSSTDSQDSSRNSQDRLSLSEANGATNPEGGGDESHRSNGLLGKVFGGNWFGGQKGKDGSRRGSGVYRVSS